MDQDPLPRGSSQVADRLAQVLDVVLELSKATVAVEAENATYITEYVIVIDVLWVWRAADRANAALRGQKFLEILLPDPVPVPQVILPRASPVLLFVLPTSNVVAWLAVRGQAHAVAATARKVLDRLHHVAVRGSIGGPPAPHVAIARLCRMLPGPAWRSSRSTAPRSMACSSCPYRSAATHCCRSQRLVSTRRSHDSTKARRDPPQFSCPFFQIYPIVRLFVRNRGQTLPHSLRGPSRSRRAGR